MYAQHVDSILGIEELKTGILRLNNSFASFETYIDYTKDHLKYLQINAELEDVDRKIESFEAIEYGRIGWADNESEIARKA